MILLQIFELFLAVRPSLLYLVSLRHLTFKCADDTGAGLAITIWIDCLGHALVSDRVVKEGADFVHDEIVIGAYEMNSAAFEGFGTLGSITHYKNGLAKTGGFLLNASRIGEDNSGLLHQINELEVLERLNEEEIWTSKVFSENFVNGFTHIGIEVHRIDEINIRVLLAEVLHGSYHADKPFTEVLTTMTSNEDELTLGLSRVESRGGSSLLTLGT
jgi:hypothetical protein